MNSKYKNNQVKNYHIVDTILFPYENTNVPKKGKENEMQIIKVILNAGL